MIESWKQSGLIAAAIVAAVMIAVALQAWSLSTTPEFAAPPFNTVDLATLRHEGIRLDPPMVGDGPSKTRDDIFAARREHYPDLPIGEVRLLRLTLLNALDGAVRQRLVWGMEILAQFGGWSGGPALESGENRPVVHPITLYWLEFYDAKNGSFIFGTVAGKQQ